MEKLSNEKAFIKDASVVALGMFDGVHIGHRALLIEAVKRAREWGIEPVAITFDEHPLKALNRPVPPMLTSRAQKAELMCEIGIGTLIERPFTKAFADLPADSYIELLGKTLRPRAVVVGYNYSFGRGGRGNAKLLMVRGSEWGFETVIMPPVSYEGVPVSSTAIREALKKGDLRAATGMLGRPYVLSIYRDNGVYLPERGMAVPGAGQYRVETGNGMMPIEITRYETIKAPGEMPDALEIAFIEQIIQ